MVNNNRKILQKIKIKKKKKKKNSKIYKKKKKKREKKERWDIKQKNIILNNKINKPFIIIIYKIKYLIFFILYYFCTKNMFNK